MYCCENFFKTMGIEKFTKNSLKLKMLRGKQAQINLFEFYI